MHIFVFSDTLPNAALVAQLHLHMIKKCVGANKIDVPLCNNVFHHMLHCMCTTTKS